MKVNSHQRREIQHPMQAYWSSTCSAQPVTVLVRFQPGTESFFPIIIVLRYWFISSPLFRRVIFRYYNGHCMVESTTFYFCYIERLADDTQFLDFRQILCSILFMQRQESMVWIKGRCSVFSFSAVATYSTFICADIIYIMVLRQYGICIMHAADARIFCHKN